MGSRSRTKELLARSQLEREGSNSRKKIKLVFRSDRRTAERRHYRKAVSSASSSTSSSRPSSAASHGGCLMMREEGMIGLESDIGRWIRSRRLLGNPEVLF
ncbi:hypothetical protein BHE74_00033517 [Ensete ventricosum]|nr:hypothetical protein BHE74_00033517 [Ensete ventricosum]